MMQRTCLSRCAVLPVMIVGIGQLPYAQAGTVLFEDFTNGAQQATAVNGVVFIAGEAVFDDPADSIRYEPVWFPAEGTIEIRGVFTTGPIVLDTRGIGARLAGDMLLHVVDPDGSIRFTIDPEGGRNPCCIPGVQSSTRVADGQMHTVSVSYGSQGLMISVDGCLEDVNTDVTAALIRDAIYVGDRPDGDGQAFTGRIDLLRTSDLQADFQLATCPNCVDCNGNGIPDGCEIAGCLGDPACADCNNNGTPDECEIANCPPNDPSCRDCNSDGRPDECGVVVVCPVAKIEASDATPGARFGISVSVNGDAGLVGAWAAANGTGEAYVFLRNGSLWDEEHALLASDGAAGDFFGLSVALDGDVALVGAYGDDCPAGTSCGAAYVFRHDGSAWVEVQKLTASDAGSDYFGRTVAVSGGVALVGAPYDDCADGMFCGSAYVFRFDGTQWVEEQKLTASDASAVDNFGDAVALQGGTAVVGAGSAGCVAGIGCGAAYVFRYNGTTWEEDQKLTSPVATAFHRFGSSLALDGDVLLVGAYSEDCAAGSTCGAVYEYRFDGSTWNEGQKLAALDADNGDHFGQSIALVGNTALIGAEQDDCPPGLGTACGAAYRFVRNGSVWQQTGKFKPPDNLAGDHFGQSVAIDGNVAFIGASMADAAAGPEEGVVYVYALGGPDCNCNSVADACDIVGGTSFDCNADAVPDECECLAASAPTTDGIRRNRNVTVRPSSAGCRTAIRVVAQNPSPWQGWNRELWLGPPVEYSELSGVVLASDAPTFPRFWGARLQCSPHYADWGSLGAVHVQNAGVVPAGQYTVQAIHEGCDPGDPGGFSPALVIQNPRWGDVAGPYDAGTATWSGPDGRVDVSLDVVAELEKFSNRPGAPGKSRADIEPCVPDYRTNITDVTRILDAFRGLAYPFAPGLGNPPCPSDPCG